MINSGLLGVSAGDSYCVCNHIWVHVGIGAPLQR